MAISITKARKVFSDLTKDVLNYQNRTISSREKIEEVAYQIVEKMADVVKFSNNLEKGNREMLENLSRYKESFSPEIKHSFDKQLVDFIDTLAKKFEDDNLENAMRNIETYQERNFKNDLIKFFNKSKINNLLDLFDSSWLDLSKKLKLDKARKMIFFKTLIPMIKDIDPRKNQLLSKSKFANDINVYNDSKQLNQPINNHLKLLVSKFLLELQLKDSKDSFEVE